MSLFTYTPDDIRRFQAACLMLSLLKDFGTAEDEAVLKRLQRDLGTGDLDVLAMFLLWQNGRDVAREEGRQEARS